MALANRHHLPGYVWHISHRCHKREFLFKFDKYKKRWIHWLFEAKKRFGLMILNFAIMSNHIHLLVYDVNVNIIPKSIQLIARRTGREYNRRKKRKGAFWEDRYHATAVKTGNHLKWTESIAVGDKEFEMEAKAKLGAKAIGRRELENNEGYELKESQNPYNRVFDPEKCSLRLKNDHIWQVS